MGSPTHTNAGVLISVILALLALVALGVLKPSSPHDSAVSRTPASSSAN